MAYVQAGISQSPDLTDEQKRQQQAGQMPTLSGGGSVGSSGGSGSAAPAAGQTPGMGASQAQSSASPQGSGFVNLQSFLTPTVAAQQQKQVAGLGTDLGAKTTGAFDDANAKTNNAIAASAPISGTPTIGGTADATGLANLHAMLGQKYTGPTGVDFNLGGNADFNRLRDLGNTDTSLQALHPENVGNVQYGQGNQWLDQSLLQGDAGTMGAIKGAGETADAVSKHVDDGSAKTAAAAADQAGKVGAARQAAIDAAKQYARGVLGKAQTAADSANDERRRVLNGAQAPGWQISDEGSGTASLSNFLNPDDAKWLNQISADTGDSSLAGTAGPAFRQATGFYTPPIGELQVKPVEQTAPNFATGLDRAARMANQAPQDSYGSGWLTPKPSVQRKPWWELLGQTGGG